MLRYRTSLVVLGGSLALAGAVYAGVPDPFRDADAIHDIGLSRLADEAGDAALLSALSGEGGPEKQARPSRERTLLAIRAAPYAAAPELLVPSLVTLATGRDPDLAPEAAHALVAIAQRLRPSELSSREVLRADLARVLQAVVDTRGQARAVRGDVALALGALEASLRALPGMASEASEAR